MTIGEQRSANWLTVFVQELEDLNFVLQRFNAIQLQIINLNRCDVARVFQS